MKLFVTGPTIGHPEFNQHAFNDTANVLLGMGHTVFNPHQADRDNGHNWDGASGTSRELQEAQFDPIPGLMDDLGWIAETADAIVALDGWHQDPTATAHAALGVALDMPIYRLCDGALVFVDATPTWVVPETMVLPVPLPGQMDILMASAGTAT